MQTRVVETLMGAAVLTVAIVFAVFAYTRSGVETVSGYELLAKFDRIDGIEPGTDVRLSGIKIGSITSVAIDPETYLAVVRMNIDPAYKLPKDSSAEVASSGLLGDKFLALVPGGDEAMLAPGGEIKFTQPSISIENMLGQLIYSAGGKNSDEKDK